MMALSYMMCDCDDMMNRLTRRAIKRRDVGAIHIQRVVRGMLCRMHYSQMLVKRRANVSQQNEHVKRMR